MKKIFLLAVIMGVGLAVFVLGAKAQGIKEGKWSMTMVTKMEGMAQESAEAMKAMENMSPEEKAMMQQMMGGMNIQANGNAMGMTTTVTKCITNENPVPETEDQKDCQKTHTLDGNTVKFEVVCTDGKSTGEITYNEDSMNGLIKSQQMVDGKDTNVTIEVTGQYVGPCTE